MVRGRLTDEQALAAKAVFEGVKSEAEIAKEAGVTLVTLRKWQKRAAFGAELERLGAAAMREARSIVLRYGPLAAARLVELLESERPDVARRAALDLLDRCLQERKEASAGEPRQKETIEPERLAGKLRVLAEAFGGEKAES